nr:AI-2E family transporter [Leucobacter luti]
MAISISGPFAVGFFGTLGGLIAILLGVAVSRVSTVIIYVVFALFVALGLDPIVRALQRARIGRPWAIVIVYAAFALVMVGVLWLIIPVVVAQVGQFFTDLPAAVESFKGSEFFAWLQGSFGGGFDALLAQVQQFITDPAHLAAISGGVLQFGAGVASTVSGLIIVLVLSLYFLASLTVMKRSFARLAPRRVRGTVRTMIDQITDSIGAYLMGMVILALCNSAVALLLTLVLGLPFPALMGVIAFCLTLIPLIGSVLFWVIASGLALFTSPLTALIFAIVYLVYMQLEAYVLTPRVMNRAVAVPGALVVIGALVGGTLLGLLGALVAVPVTASILLIITQVLIPRQDAKG